MKTLIWFGPTKNHWLLFIVNVLIYSCTFKSDEVYVRKTNEVLPPTVEVIQLDLLKKDTIVLHNNVNISFEFKSLGQPVYQTIVTIDGKEQNVIKSNKGSFFLSFYALSDGMHDLQLDLYTKTGTGSIAERLDAEAFVTTQKWKVMVYKNFNTDVTSDVINGYLKVKLSPYLAPDFKEFVISTDDYFTKSEKKIRAQEFIDSSYFGQPRRFNFFVRTTDSLLIPWGSLGLTRNLPTPIIKQTGKHQYEFRFTKAKYYGGIDTFIIYQEKYTSYYKSIGGGTSSNIIHNDVKRTTDYIDTIYTYIDSALCQEQRFSIRYIPKVNASGWKKNGDMGNTNSRILTGAQYRFGGSYYIEPINNDEFLYFDSYKDGSMCKYSIPQQKVIGQNPFIVQYCYNRNFINISVSPSGKYATYFEPCFSSVKFINTSNLQNVTSHNLDTYIGYSPRITPIVSISDIATGIVNLEYGGFCLYDFVASKPIAKYRERSYVVKGLKISADGNFFWVNDDNTLILIQLKDNDFSGSIASLKFSDAKFFDFNKSNAEQLYLHKGNTFSIKKCSDFSDVTSYVLNDSMILSIDSHNNEMLTFNSGYLFVRNISDGKILHKFPCGFIPYPGQLFCHIRNHYLIFSHGVIYPIY